MARTKRKDGLQSRWIELADELRRMVPHLSGVLASEDEFINIRILARDDGTTLAVLKRYGPDGGPMVCFGSGYGVVGCLLAIDSAIQGGNWRVDEPWDNKKE